MPIIRVFDVETTGFDPKEHRVIEIAAFDLHPDNRIKRVGAHLVNPKRTIPPDASAVHHLIDADIAGAQHFDAVWASYLRDAPVYYAAHNCEFEQGYIPTPDGTQWICTQKCALRVWADAPRHTNQALRYWLGLDTTNGFDRQLAAHAHRAEPDAYVTAWILKALLVAASVDDLIAWSKQPKPPTARSRGHASSGQAGGAAPYPDGTLTFGKHRGEKWSDVPAGYLQWLQDGSHRMDAAWRHGAKVELERRANKVELEKHANQRAVVTCPSCQGRLSLPAGRSGRVNCPRCQNRFEATT